MMKVLFVLMLSLLYLSLNQACAVEKDADIGSVPPTQVESILQGTQTDCQLYDKAKLNASSGDFGAAEQCITQIILVNPNPVAFCERADYRLKQRDVQGCLDDCSQAIKLNAKFVPALQLKSRVLRGLRRIEEAVACDLLLLEIEEADILRRRNNLKDEASHAKLGVFLMPVTFGGP